MWVQIEVRRLTGWVVPTCRIVFVLTLRALSMSIGASSWTAVGLYTLRTSQEDSIVSAGEWAGPCCVHCA